MRTAVVILNWNGRKMMERFLPSVIEHTGDEAEIVVADNASTDDSLTFLEVRYPHVRRIVLDQNYGFAEGYNRALKQVDADYYVLLNSDVEVTHGWLTTLVDYLDEHPEVAACQPKLLSESRRTHFEYAGAAGGYMDRYGYPFCRGRIFQTVEEDRGQHDTPREVFWTTGACMVVRSADYWAAGGLDGRFFAHCEEIDLCWRLRLLGRKLCCIPKSVVYHVGGGTLPQGNPRKTYLNFRNNLLMLYKNLSKSDLWRVMLIRLALDYVAAFEALLLHGHWGDFKAILRARLHFHRMRPSFRADRRHIQATARLHHIPEIMPICLIWQYYARGKRTWDVKFVEKFVK